MKEEKKACQKTLVMVQSYKCIATFDESQEGREESGSLKAEQEEDKKEFYALKW